MRIAMLGHKRIPSREGGVEIVVAELAARMAAQGHEVTSYNRRGHHVSGKAFDAGAGGEYCGVRLRNVPAIQVKGLAAMTASLIASIRAAFGRYDVVHFHTEGPCATIWLPKLTGKRCIATVHGLDHRRNKWGRTARNYILLGERAAARFADEIIVLSEGARQYFRNTYGRETTLIPNGFPQAHQRAPDLITRQFGLAGNDYILYLGRITPEKGLDCLLEAFRQLKTEAKLVIAGGSSDSAAYFANLRAEAGEDSRILFTDFVQGAVLEELYSNAILYVLPSQLEGMPISLLEAMSYGNCCLVSDIPENRDVIGQCGETFRQGDAADLSRKLEELLTHPERLEQYRQAAKQENSSRPDWDEVVRQTLLLYQRSG